MCLILESAPIGGVEPEPVKPRVVSAASGVRPQWRLDSVSQRTILWFDTTSSNKIKRKPKKTFRNPIILAREMSLMMDMEELNRAELARKLGLSRARVTQILNLLGLPKMLITDIEEMGDHWSKQLVTERQLRRLDI